MANDSFILVEVTGNKTLADKLKKLAPAIGAAGVEAVNAYLLNVLRTYPPPNYVTRREAYGRTFFTDRQRRWFFWALHNGVIDVPYRRTQQLARGWIVQGRGQQQYLYNDTPGASFVQGHWPGEQSRHENKVGWKGVNIIIEERMRQILRTFSVGVKRAANRLGMR